MIGRKRGRVDLSLKGLRDEPEDEAAIDEVDPEEEWEEGYDEFEDVEVLSSIELAFKKAIEADGGEVPAQKRTGKKRQRKDNRAIQDEIIARTLDTARK